MQNTEDVDRVHTGREFRCVVISGETLHAVQSAMVEGGGVQCGFCTPGFVVAAAHLFETNPSPTSDEIREALSGNICRCTGYGAILRSLEELGR